MKDVVTWGLDVMAGQEFPVTGSALGCRASGLLQNMWTSKRIK